MPSVGRERQKLILLAPVSLKRLSSQLISRHCA